MPSLVIQSPGRWPNLTVQANILQESSLEDDQTLSSNAQKEQNITEHSYIISACEKID